MRIDEIWVVTVPTDLTDIDENYFKTTIPRLELQYKGGMTSDEIVAVFSEEPEAKEFARLVVRAYGTARQKIKDVLSTL